MKRFKMLANGTDLKTIYEGERKANGSYVFKAISDPVDNVSFRFIKSSEVELRRENKELVLSALLKVNQKVSMQVLMKDQNLKGDIPILVTDIKENYPKEIVVMYYLLDANNVPFEKHEIVVYESE